MPERRRVMIVEDEPRMRELLLDVLPDMGWAPVAVPTAEEGLRLMQDQPAEIILLDLNLPVMDGLEFLKRLRRRWPVTPVILMTAFGSLDAARQAIHLDVVDFLAKPCHLGEIEASLDRARRRLEAAGGPAMTNAADSNIAAGEGSTLADLERAAIFDALQRHGGNRSAAAAALGISRRTLYNKLEEYQRQAQRRTT